MLTSHAVRERNFLSWSKFFMLTTVLSAFFFLDLQIQDSSQHAQYLVNKIELMSTDPSFPLFDPKQDVYGLPQTEGLHSAQPSLMTLSAHQTSSNATPPTEEIVLGAIYFVVAFLSWTISTYDYFKCIKELETEHTYLDECEGHSHPMVTLLSILICIIVLSTVIYLLVQRTT